MTASEYMPALVVEVAWDGGFRIPMADWTWTDVSDYVELDANLTISGGRNDERSTADANTLTLTFDNSDGRFTAGRITSPYYPDVVLYKPIRVLATPVDGSESRRFTGYLTSLPVQWEDTAAYAKATVSAVSRLARLGLNARWRSLVEQTILADAPLVYYPLGDPEGSTLAADASGRGERPLALAGDPTLPVVFGLATGPGTDDLTAATFAGGEYLKSGIPTTSPTAESIEAFVLGSTLATATVATTSDLALNITSSGWAELAIHNGATLVATTTSGGNIMDGATHHLAGTWDGTTIRLYVDGALTSSFAQAGSPTLNSVAVGGGGPVIYSPFTGVVAHVAAYDTALTLTQIQRHAAAGTTAWAGELTDARFVRYAEMAGIDAAEVDADTGTTATAHIDTTDANIVDLLRMIEATEAGVMFDDRDGTLTLHSRSHRYGASSAVTLDMAKHEVEADYSPRLDPSALFNDITVTGATSAHLTDEPSIEANGVATASLSTASQDPDEPLNLAAWALIQFATPKPRVPSLSVNVTDQAAFYSVGESPVSSADLMSVTIGDKITVANHPQQAATSITDYYIEGWTETYGPESLTITWNVSPSTPDDMALIVGDPLRGVVGTNYVAL